MLKMGNRFSANNFRVFVHLRSRWAILLRRNNRAY